jgi:hypothetical protein
MIVGASRSASSHPCALLFPPPPTPCAGEVITPEEVMDLMEEDVKAADLIAWVGISFQQSASTVYFRNVRHWLAEAQRAEHVVQAVVNPSDEAVWNLMTACSNQRGWGWWNACPRSCLCVLCVCV